jgi:homoserine O-acetyltransferase
LHWFRDGDEPGRRQFARIGPLELEAGGSLPTVTMAYETWGDPSAPPVLVLHALTGDSHASGPAMPGHLMPGWWDGIVGPGGAIDTERFFVVCPNVLGGCQGTTGPSSIAPEAGRPYGGSFPVITIRDQVAAEMQLADNLGIERWHAVAGGSMGGMRVLEWAVGAPERVARAVVVAVGAEATAEQIALCSVQNRAIRGDPHFRGGDYYDGPFPDAGMGLARRIGHYSYRSEPELAVRFGRVAQGDEQPLAGGRYAIESYLDHQAAKLVDRFDANSYLVLSDAMNHHDVGRGRGGVAAALARVTAEVTVAGIESDRLYPLRLQRQMASLLPGQPRVEVIPSLSGHDGFLIEGEAVGKVIDRALG